MEGLPWPVCCCKDFFEQADESNWHKFDYVWVSGKRPKAASRSLAVLPFQGSRFYHVSAVSMILQNKLGHRLGLGIRASVHLPSTVFAEPLQQIVENLSEDLGKLACNSWIGALQCREVKWKVFSSSDRNIDIPFRGPKLYKEAPGGWDVMCQQRVCTLSSYRMIWHAVLDRELCLMTALRNEGFTIKQMRVDGLVCHVSRKGKKRLLELEEEAWSNGSKIQSEEAC